jgi:hypothetical protein
MRTTPKAWGVQAESEGMTFSIQMIVMRSHLCVLMLRGVVYLAPHCLPYATLYFTDLVGANGQNLSLCRDDALRVSLFGGYRRLNFRKQDAWTAIQDFP